MITLINATANRIPLPDASVHCVVTSPPYWGLRDYGLPGRIWGGEIGCNHVWNAHAHNPQPHGDDGHKSKLGGGTATQASTRMGIVQSAFCQLCEAWRGCLGLEPTPEMYVQHMVEVFREVWRVLRSDGTVFLNLGDSYWGGKGTSGSSKARATAEERGYHQSAGTVQMNKRPQDGTHNVLKPKDLVGIPWRVAFALQADGWWLRSDIIWSKCLSGGAIVYAKTQKGEMPMTVKDMVRLNPATIKLWDGEKWNQAESWELSPRQGNELEIELRNGERISCTPDHKWVLVGDRVVVAQCLKKGDVLESTTLPGPEQPREPAWLPDYSIGWFVGLYIAEGSQSEGTIQIASHVKEQKRLERLQAIAKALDGYCFSYQTSEHGMTINLNSPVLLGVIKTYVSGKGAKRKHLHVRCWARSNKFLDGVLQGYLEGDGHRRKNDSWRLSYTNNDALTSDLRTLCARLGFSIRLKRCKHQCGDRFFPGWRGDLYLNSLKRKTSDRAIVAIRKSRARKFWNISLQEPPHYFALASGTCTMNSNPMPESVTDRPTKSHEYLFLLSKNRQYFYDAEAVREKYAREYQDGPGFGGFANRTNTKYKDVGNQGAGPEAKVGTGRNRRTVWTVSTKPYKGAHFATYPPALVEPCIKAGCPLNGVVLDPFVGSGTTLLVARQLGRNGIGLDLSFDYLSQQARKRLELDKLKAWTHGGNTPNVPLNDLPLFRFSP